jgi:hypothetical protein
MYTPWRFSDSEHEGGNVATQLDDLIEQVWLDLGGQVSHARIRQVATETVAMFRDATVTAYIPILLRRRIRERLQQKVQTDEV